MDQTGTAKELDVLLKMSRSALVHLRVFCQVKEGGNNLERSNLPPSPEFDARGEKLLFSLALQKNR